jgi:hypothetical protein
MKFTFIFILALIMAAAVLSQGQKRMSNSAELIKQLDKKLTNALVKGESASVEAIIGDNYVEINAQGEMRRKSDVIAEVRMRASAPPSKSAGPEVSEETEVSIHGETAILIGLRTTTYQHMVYQTLPSASQTPAPTAKNQERFIKVYSNVSGRWQLVAFQKTSIAQGQNQSSLQDKL